MKLSRSVMSCALALAVVVAGGLVSLPTSGADSKAVARRHAARANKLAAKNKCKQAIPWFNRAYRTLKDPSLLFNRAECLRKLGENQDAIKDYEQFLSEMPKAPNRALVEKRIASLNEALNAASAPSNQGEAAQESGAAAAATQGGPGDQAEAPAAPPPVRRAEKWMD